MPLHEGLYNCFVVLLYVLKVCLHTWRQGCTREKSLSLPLTPHHGWLQALPIRHQLEVGPPAPTAILHTQSGRGQYAWTHDQMGMILDNLSSDSTTCPEALKPNSLTVLSYMVGQTNLCMSPTSHTYCCIRLTDHELSNRGVVTTHTVLLNWPMCVCR